MSPSNNELLELEKIMSNSNFNINQFIRNIFENSVDKKNIYEMRDVLAKLRDNKVSSLKDFVYDNYTDILSVSTTISEFEKSLNPLKDNLEKQIRNVRKLKKLPNILDETEEKNSSFIIQQDDSTQSNDGHMSKLVSELMDLDNSSCQDDEMIEIIQLLDMKNRDLSISTYPKNILNRLHITVLNNQIEKMVEILGSTELDDYLSMEHGLVEKKEIKNKIRAISDSLTLNAEKLFLGTNKMFVFCGSKEREILITSMMRLGCTDKACEFFLEYHRKQLFDFYDNFMSRPDSDAVLEQNTIEYFSKVTDVVREFRRCFKPFTSILSTFNSGVGLIRWVKPSSFDLTQKNYDNYLLCWLMAVTRIFIESFMSNIKNRKLPFTVAPNQYHLLCTKIKDIFEVEGLTLQKYIDLCIHRHLESLMEAFTHNMIKLIKADQKNENWQNGVPIKNLYSINLIKLKDSKEMEYFKDDILYHLPNLCNSLTKLVEIFILPFKVFSASQLLCKVVNINMCKILISIVQHIKENHADMQNSSYFRNYLKFLFNIFLPYISEQFTDISQYNDYQSCDSYLSSVVNI